MIQTNNNISVLQSQINQDDLKELEDRAYKVLPHVYIYNENRKPIGMIAYTEETRPELTYEEFIEQLDFYRDNEDTEGINRRARELERIEKGINLAVDVADFPEPDWLVEGFIVKNGLTMLYGDSGTGKTTLCLYLADSMRKGKALFGLECKQGTVIFVENDESGDLLKSHRDKVGLPERLLVASPDTNIVWDGSNKKFTEDFQNLLYYYVPDVVVVDSYTSLGIPDITRPESSLVLDELRRLAERYHCGMIIIHHTNLSGTQMGSSLHRAKMDSMVCLSKISESRILLTQEKIRGSKFPPKVINFNQDTLEMTDANMTLKEQVKELKAVGMRDDEILSNTPKSKRDTVRRYLRESPKSARLPATS